MAVIEVSVERDESKHRMPCWARYRLTLLGCQPSLISAVPDSCCIVTWRLVESVGGMYVLLPVQLRLYLEQWFFVDRLRTATVYTEQATGCPRWDRGVSVMLMPRLFGVLQSVSLSAERDMARSL